MLLHYITPTISIIGRLSQITEQSYYRITLNTSHVEAGLFAGKVSSRRTGTSRDELKRLRSGCAARENSYRQNSKSESQL